MTAEPRTPASASEVRWAAGYTPYFVNRESGEKQRFKVLHQMDKDAGVWVSSCLDRHVYVESGLGASLAESQAAIIEEIESELNGGDFFDLPAAPPEDFELWDKIQAVRKTPAEFGNADDILKSIRASDSHEKASTKYFEIREAVCALAA